jgi:hypothetical protein
VSVANTKEKTAIKTPIEHGSTLKTAPADDPPGDSCPGRSCAAGGLTGPVPTGLRATPSQSNAVSAKARIHDYDKLAAGEQAVRTGTGMRPAAPRRPGWPRRPAACGSGWARLA